MEASKTNCIPLDKTAIALGISRSTLTKYTNYLGITYRRFKFDRKAYIEKVDLEILKLFMEENKSLG